MERKLLSKNLINDSSSHVFYEPVNQCPCCKTTLNPVNIASAICGNADNHYFFAIEYCSMCNNVFVSKYSLSNYLTSSTFPYKIKPSDGDSFIASNLISCEPNRFSKHIFDPKIVAISPQFDKIYNQALAAESSGLDEIAGLGYRKALEFLIKDYAIHEHPNDIDVIKVKNLSQCIRQYIANDTILTLAERSAWIGNDEAHYVRKHENRDVSDMKSFIQAIVYFIGMTLIAEDASSIPKK